MQLFTEILSVKYLILIYVLLALPWVFATQARVRTLFGSGFSLFLNILRGLVLLAVLLLFAGLIVMLPERGEPQKVAVLVDRSFSMQLPVSSGGAATRSEQADSALRELETLLGQSREIERFWMGKSAVTSEDSTLLGSIEGGTDIVAALDEASTSNAEDVQTVIITDGRVTLGRATVDSLVGERQPTGTGAGRGTPVYSLMLGEPLDIYDASITGLVVEELVYQGERVPVRVLLTGYGPGEGNLVVSIDVDSEAVERREVKLAGLGTSIEIVTELPAMKDGFHMLDVSIEMPGEQFTGKNDRRSLYLEVKRSGKRVVLFSTTPDWDFAFLSRHVESFSEYEPTVFVVGANGAVTGLEGPDHLDEQAGGSCADALESADIVVLHGDITKLPPEVRHAAASRLERGGVGVLIFPLVPWQNAGEWRDLEALCPYRNVVDRIPSAGTVTGTTGSRNHPVISLGLGDDFDSWNELPPLGEVLTGTKLAGDYSGVLTAPVTGGVAAPVMAASDRGEIRALVLLASGFWQWDMFPQQFGKGPYFKALSRGMLEWLGEPSLFGSASCVPAEYSVRAGDGIAFAGPGEGEGHSETEVTVTTMPKSREAGGGDTTIVWQATFGSRGEDRSPAAYLPPGLYSYAARRLRDGDWSRAGEGSFYVDGSSDEFDDPRPDAVFLEDLARSTGGMSVPADEVQSLVDELNRTGDRGKGVIRVDLRREPLVYIFLLAAFFVELIIRRKKGLP